MALSTQLRTRLFKSFEAQPGLNWSKVKYFFLNTDGSTQVLTTTSPVGQNLINILPPDVVNHTPSELDSEEVLYYYNEFMDGKLDIRVPPETFHATIKAMKDSITAEDARAATATPPYNPLTQQWYVDLVNQSNQLESLVEEKE